MQVIDKIAAHHTLYKNLFMLPLHPKHHNLLHYPYIMEKHLSTLRYESKHQELKKSANVVTSRVNITQTLAKKHQLKLSHKFRENSDFKYIIHFDKEVNCLQDVISSFPNFYDLFGNWNRNLVENFKNVYFCKKVNINNTTYKINGIIFIKNSLSLK